MDETRKGLIRGNRQAVLHWRESMKKKIFSWYGIKWIVLCGMLGVLAVFGMAAHLPKGGDDTAFAALAQEIGQNGEWEVTEPVFQKDGDIYLIQSAQDMRKLAVLVNENKMVETGVMAQTASYRLTADIDLSEYCSENGGWEPIGYTVYEPIPGKEGYVKAPETEGYFNGTFDGDGHMITGLYINRPNEQGQGLFGLREDLRPSDAWTYDYKDNEEYEAKRITTIKNLYIKDCRITGSYYTGGVMGGMYNFDQGEEYGAIHIENCHVTGTIDGSLTVGGVAGSASMIKDSSFAGSVSAGSSAGGIAGEAYDINGCAVLGDISGNNAVGGIGGTAVCVRNSYVVGSVTGYNSVGGITGWGACLTGCYTRADVTGYTRTGGLIGDIQSLNLMVPEGTTAWATIRGCLMGGYQMTRAEKKDTDSSSDAHDYNGYIYGFPGADMNVNCSFPYRENLYIEGFGSGMYEFSEYLCEPLDFGALNRETFEQILETPETDWEDVWISAADHAYPNLAWERESRFGYTVTVIVREGDSLTSLAADVYGDASRWQELYEENYALIGDDPNLILTGMELDMAVDR